MTIAIHQPNYLPWLGYFAKIHMSDVFVFHDAVQFSDRAYTKRTRIREAKDSATTTWLTVPVQNHSSDASIMDVAVDHSTDWRLAHVHKIRNTYASAACFDDVFPQLERMLERVMDHTLLGEMNSALIKALCELLGIRCAWHRSSRLQAPGTAENLNCNIVAALGGHTYLSGTGAQSYQEGSVFEAAGIRLQYADVQGWLGRNPYPQGDHPFVAGLSVIDTLMHVGIKGVSRMLDAITNDVAPTG